MVGARAVAIALLWAAVALAGCLAGGGADDKAAGDGDAKKPPSQVRADVPTERPGKVEGTVKDGEGNAVADARLTLEGAVDINLQASSDEMGKFVFDGLPNGSYALVAEKTGFEAAQLPFVLAPGETKAVELVMVALAVEVPALFNTTIYEGKLACGYQTSLVSSNVCGAAPATTGDRSDLRFVVPMGAKSVIAEWVWTKNAENGASRLFGNLDALGAGNAWREMNETSGQSPFMIRIDEGEQGKDEAYPFEQATENVTWRVVTGMTSSVSAPEVVKDQAYKVYVTVFWNQVGPEDFTALAAAS